LIVDGDLAAKRVIGHPFKHETRLENENSEDALTWNVFRSLQRTGRLHEIARLITGQVLDDEPRLYPRALREGQALLHARQHRSLYRPLEAARRRDRSITRANIAASGA
jgi:hypothetical protein